MRFRRRNNVRRGHDDPDSFRRRPRRGYRDVPGFRRGGGVVGGVRGGRRRRYLVLLISWFVALVVGGAGCGLLGHGKPRSVIGVTTCCMGGQRVDLAYSPLDAEALPRVPTIHSRTLTLLISY